ncbi:unnamed protein product [Urochloa humidicola]
MAAPVSTTYPVRRDQNYGITYNVLAEIDSTAAHSHDQAMHMMAYEHQQTYKKIRDLLGRFRRTVTCRTDDTVLIPRHPASSSRSALIDHSYHAPVTSARPPHPSSLPGSSTVPTFASPSTGQHTYAPRPAAFYTTGTP